jgi:tetratricopeptide (TPR) repeat protein
MTERFDVFVSHSSVDKPWVHRLVAGLERYGVSVWLDETQIRPGTSILSALERGIEASNAMILVVSPEAMASGWVREEYDRAITLAQRKGMEFPIIAAVLRQTELPGFLQSRRWVAFLDPDRYAAGVADLVWGIKGTKPAEVLDLDANALPPLPGEHVPEPAPLPRGSRMHIRRNPQFVGRMDQLRALTGALQVQGRAAIGQVASVTGLGGIGKTQLAAELVHRYGQFFSGGVFWLSFADPASVPREFAQCGGPGHLGLWTDATAPDIATQADRVSSAFAGPEPRLLVFDNCEDETLLAEWLPATGGCRVLVTCRRAAFSPHLVAHTVPLDVLPRADSLELLHSLAFGQTSDGTDEAALDAICAELGDLPLALHLAGSFLAGYRATTTPAVYLAELRSAALLGHESLQGDSAGTSPTGHVLHVGRTFALSWERLDPANELDATARDLLQRAACLAPGEPIPHALCVAILGKPEDSRAARRQERALRRLLDLGLLDAPEPDTYRIHRLVANFARHTGGDHTAARATVEQALMDEASRVNDSGYPTRLLPWQPHLRAVTDAARAREDERAAYLCHELAHHLRAIGDYRAARPYFERALAIRAKQLGLEHPDTAQSLSSLAGLLQAQGALAEARPLYERALSILEKQLGPEHPDTALSLNNLALLLKDQGALGEARPLYERALAIYEKQFGPEHPLTTRSLNNLAALLQAQGELSEARLLFERTLAIREKQLGPEHPLLAASLNNLAALLQAQGELSGARPLYERALAIYEERLGPEHPHTATSLNNLAGLLKAQGKLSGARPLYERALAICEERLGPEHPDTATSLSNLAGLLRAQGELSGARPLYERALAICEKQLGPEHPHTATSLNNLAALLQAQGELSGARPLYERALAICEKQLGPEHPHTAESLNNLAGLLYAQGELSEARPLYERALAICEKQLGPDHPSTRIVRDNLQRLLEP